MKNESYTYLYPLRKQIFFKFFIIPKSINRFNIILVSKTFFIEIEKNSKVHMELQKISELS